MAHLNFSSVPKRVPLAEGMYLLTIVKAEEKDSSTGNKMLVVQFSEPDTKTVIFENFSYVPEALFKLQNLLEALGYDAGDDMEFNAADIIGGVVKAKVIQREYEGSVQNSAKKFYAA
jgi:hypothetical protein